MRKSIALAAMSAAALGAIPAQVLQQRAEPDTQARAAAIKTAAASPGTTAHATPAQDRAQQRHERHPARMALLAGYAYSRPRFGRSGPGWTHAQVQRMARKKRNQARNKLAHRGGK